MANLIFKLLPGSALTMLLIPLSALAQTTAAETIRTGLSSTAEKSGFKGSAPLTVLIGNVIQALLGVVGLVFLILTVYAGFLYLTDAGGGEKVKKAKSILGTSVIGLVIVIAAYALTDYVITALVSATNPNQPG